MRKSSFKEIIFPLSRKEKQYQNHPALSGSVYDKMSYEMDGSRKVYRFTWWDNPAASQAHAAITSDRDYDPRMHPQLAFAKQTRFSPVPLHHHEYLELNYMYSGSCMTVINDTKLELKTGDVCIMDRDAVHSISALGEQDILLNCLMKQDYFDIYLMRRLAKSGIVAEFLSAVISSRTTHDKYLIFHTADNPQIREIFEHIFCEYIDPGICSITVLDNYMSLLLVELARCYKETVLTTQENRRNDIAEILTYMEEHFRDCTLGQAAEHFGYHPNYLSRAVRKATGKSFKEHMDLFRLNRAEYQLLYTNESITEIAFGCGWSNLNQFYKKFKEAHGVNPGDYRIQNRTALPNLPESASITGNQQPFHLP